MTSHELGADRFERVLTESLGRGEPSIRVRQAVLCAAAEHNQRALRQAARRATANRQLAGRMGRSAPAGPLTQGSSRWIETSHIAMMRVRLTT